MHQKVLCDILTKDWWTRLWTVQEYVLARDPIFLYGKAVIEDSALRKYIDLYKELNLSEVESLESPQMFRFTRTEFFETYDKMALHEYDARTALPELQLLRAQLLTETPSDTPASKESALEVDLRVLTSGFHRRATVAADKILGLLGILQSELSKAVPLSPTQLSRRSISRWLASYSHLRQTVRNWPCYTIPTLWTSLIIRRPGYQTLILAFGQHH
jgi:hypothetical protein